MLATADVVCTWGSIAVGGSGSSTITALVDASTVGPLVGSIGVMNMVALWPLLVVLDLVLI